MEKNVDLFVSEFLLCCDSSVRLFSSKCPKYRTTKNHRNLLGDRLELWPSKHTLQMVNNSKDKNGSVKLIEFRSLLKVNSHR